MSRGFAAKQQFRHRDQSEEFDLLRRILQAERDQKADAARIDDAISKAESNIAALSQRHLASEDRQRALIAVRDRTILTVRDVRKNMQTRNNVAKTMQETLSDDYLRQRSRFDNDDIEDKKLRTGFFELLKRTPTYGLIDHLRDALKVGNTACAESIRFEFKCRDDRHQYIATFKAIVANLSPCDPVEMRQRLSNIRSLTQRVDARIATLLERARSPQEVKMASTVQERAMKATGCDSANAA